MSSQDPTFIQEQEKIPNRGQENLFREFKDYNQMTHTKVYRPHYSLPQEHLNKINSVDIPRKTNHLHYLEKFLKKSQYSTPQQTDSKVYSKPSPNNRTHKTSYSVNTQQSFYFIGPERFNDRNTHLDKTLYEDNYSKINPFMDKSPFTVEASENLYQKNYQLNQSKSPFTFTEKIHQDINDKILKAPQQRRQEHRQIKKQLVDKQDWYKTYCTQSKRQRILENAFRSGILSVDSPENPQSKLYSTQYKKHAQSNNKKEFQHNYRKQVINKYRSSSPGIEMYQSDTKPSVKNYKGKDILEYFEPKKKVDLPHMQKFKEKTEKMFYPKNSAAQNIQRQQYLISQERRDRQYNVITNTVL